MCIYVCVCVSVCVCVYVVKSNTHFEREREGIERSDRKLAESYRLMRIRK